MTKYGVKYHPEVKTKDRLEINPDMKARIKKAIEERLQVAPHDYGLPLRKSLKRYWKLRVGDYRIVYKIDGNTVQVKAFWDSEARVWVAESDDVPGLVTEADTMEQLIDKLHILIPELLQENEMLNAERKEIPFDVYSERKETVHCG